MKPTCKAIRKVCLGGAIAIYGALLLLPMLCHSQSMQQLITQSDAGDPKAEYLAGKIYSNGSIGRVNYPAAAKLFRRSAESGNMNALAELGMFYTLGHGVTADTTKGRALVLEAAEKGSAVGLRYVATQEQYALGTRLNLSDAIRLYRKAIAAGDIPSLNRLAMIYIHGRTGVCDVHVALELLKSGSSSGDPWAELHLGELYAAGKLTDIAADPRELSDRDIPVCNPTQMASELANSHGTSSALTLYETAAAAGNPIASYRTAEMIEASGGGSEGLKVALQYYRRSVALG